MSSNFAQSRGGLFDRLFWDLSFKNRKILIPILILVIFVLTLLVIKNFVEMDLRLKKLSKFEPMYVLGINRDLNVGDVITTADLTAFLFYKNEYEKLSHKNLDSNLEEPALIPCTLDQNSNPLSETKVIGRVVTIPVYKNSFLRKEFLAPEGTLPGLVNLLEKDHAIADVEVPQTGFNVFIKPNDYVDLAEISKTGSQTLIADKVKVILVDSLPLGKAAFHVHADEKAKRHLTLSIPQEKLAQLTSAIKNKTLVVTYKNTVAEVSPEPSPRPKQLVKKPSLNPFQSLMMITGSKKELITQ